MKLGDIQINTVYLGDINIGSMYLGDTRVFGGQSVDNAIRFTAISNATISLSAYGTSAPQLWYSTDGRQTWVLWDYSSVSFTGDLFIKGLNTDGISTSETDYSKFNIVGQVRCSGNIMHLIDYTQNITFIPSTFCFYHLFDGCTGLLSAPKLPATTLTSGCYDSMFNDCSSLTQAPVLPATVLTYKCYYQMFGGCEGLTAIPNLPATTLANNCYQNMFNGCSSLTTISSLPETALANYCYAGMFANCSSLTQIPELPYTSLTNYCYSQMFEGCVSLEEAPELPATTLANGCYSGMFKGCTSLTQAPELPATTLVTECYSNMFYGCSLIDIIKADFLTEPGTDYTENWLYGVAQTGTFTPNQNATWKESITRGSSTIPEGWTIYTPPAYNFNTRVVRNGSWSTDFTNNFDITVTPTSQPNQFKVEFTYNGAQGEGWRPAEASCQIYNITDNPWYIGTPTYSNSWGGNIWQSSGRSMTSESGNEYDHTVNHYFNDYGISWNTGYTLTVTITTV